MNSLLKTDASEYMSLNMALLAPESPLPCDLYLFLNEHFIKYKSKGDVIPFDKYNLFFSKKTDFIFCLREDFKHFEAWAQSFEKKENDRLVSQVGENNREMVKKRESVKTELFKIFSGEVTEEKCLRLQESTRRFVESMITKKSSVSCLQKLMNYDPLLSEHSINVGTLSIYLCYHLGYVQQVVLENVYMGCLLHDVGKTQIDMETLEKANEKDYEKLMKDHVELGVKALGKITTLAPEILKIVAEHHEHNDGTGYPRRLRGGRIYELTKIVSIANIFDNVAMKAPGSLKARQMAALEYLRKDHDERFDPKKLQKCLDVLRHGL